MASLILYGSNVANATLTTAGQASNTTGGTETSATSNISGANNYGEVNSSGTANASVTAIPTTPTGRGWVYKPGAGTFATSNWSAVAAIASTVHDTVVLTMRFFKYSSGTYTSIGTISTASFVLPSARSAQTFTAASLSTVTFSSSDLLYWDIWLYDSTGAGGDYPQLYLSNSGTAGVANDVQITTSSFTPAGTVVDHTWTMRGKTASLTDHRWQMRSRVSGLADHHWQMRGNIGTLADHHWQMRSRISGVGDHLWRIRGNVGQGADHTWQLRGNVASLTDHRWQLRGRVSGLTDHRWQMRGRVGATTIVGHLWSMRGNIVARPTSGGFALGANGTGTASFDSFRVAVYPDPSITGAGVGRATSALVNWNATLPTNTSLAVSTSLDNGITWSSVAAPGNAIPGIAVQPAPVIDTFATNTSANYIQSNFGGTTGAWTWDTANGRLIGSGGNGGTLVNATALTGADNLVAPDFDQADGSGLIANYQSASAMYYVQLWDASGTGTQNAVKLFKRSGGVSTQLGSTVPIDWPRGRYRRFILDVQDGMLTVSMDGVQLIQQTDGSPLAVGQSGLLLGTLLRCVELRVQQYGQDVTDLSVCTQLTLSSTDPTATPQVLDLQTFLASADIDPGALIPTASYLRTYLSDNIKNLDTQSATTWWYVRPDKSVAFQQRKAVPAPWILDSANKTALGPKKQGDLLVANLKLTTSGDLYRNRQVLTGVLGTTTFNETRKGDGSTRTWNLSNPVLAAPTITLNGQPVTSVGIKGVDTGKVLYYQPGSVTIDQDSSQTLLNDVDVLAISYSGSFVAEVVRDNAVPGTFPGTISQAELAAIDKTSGIVENVLDVSKMKLSVAAAQSYGDSLLATWGVLNARTLSFDTLRDGLLPGQDLSVYVPEQQCIGAHMLIAQVGITAKIAPSVPGGVLYWYSIIATEGPALGSTWKLLSSLFKP